MTKVSEVHWLRSERSSYAETNYEYSVTDELTKVTDAPTT